MSIIWVEPMTKCPDSADGNHGGSDYYKRDAPCLACGMTLKQAEDSLYECERCGELVDELFTVDDADPSVGYRNTLELCAKCLENPRTAEDRYADKVDREYENYREGF